MNQKVVEKKKSPREEWLAAQKEMAKDNAQTEGNDLGFSKEETEMIDQIEEEIMEVGEELESIDKNMEGSEKIVVTKEEYQKMKAEKFDKDTAAKITQLSQLNAKYLTVQEALDLKEALKSFEAGKFDSDPIMKHIVTKRLEIYRALEDKQSEAKNLQMKLLNALTTLTDEVVKCKGALEAYDRDIIKEFKKKVSNQK